MIAQTLMILLSIISFANEPSFEAIKDIKNKEISKPKPLVESNTGSKITSYVSKETFPFELDAKKSCEEKLLMLKNYGISVIGCNIIKKGNDYSFTIEYISELKNPQSVNSVIITDYTPLKTYWNESLAKKEMENSFTKFKSSPLKPIDKKIVENGGEYTFNILYVVQNIIKKQQKYYVRIDKVKLGNYIFESEAKKNIQSLINLLKQSGVAPIGGKVVENNNEYAIEIEYLNKTDESLAQYNNPEYSIDTYISEEVFPFEDNALREGLTRNDSFTKLGMSVLLNYAVPTENDWTFGIDYVVKNIYKNGVFTKKEFSIKRYINPQRFDFEADAKKSLNEKIKNFNDIGLYPVSYRVIEDSQEYSFIIDYIEKN